MVSLIDSILSMKMDVYIQTDVQDENTGAIKKEWTFSRTVDCHAKGVISNSVTSRNGDRQSFNNKYVNDQVIQVRTVGRIVLREKVTNIRDSENNVIWAELDYPNDTPTVFEVIGSTPVTDPFGRVLAYNTTMRRSENQQIGF
jgi:hypothetical protein